jgi:hypothetical protein
LTKALGACTLTLAKKVLCLTDLHVNLSHAVDHANAWKDYGVPFSTAVLGALLAYVPSSLLAQRASRELLKRDQKARYDADVAADRRVYIKLNILVNSILGFYHHIEEMIKKADEDGNTHMSIAQRLSVFPGIDREQTLSFTAEELEFLIVKERVDLVDDLILLARRHSSMLSNLAAFGAMKTEIHYELAKHGFTTRDRDSVSNTAATLPPTLGNYFRVKADEINLYAIQMRSLIADFAQFARAVASKYGEVSKIPLA